MQQKEGRLSALLPIGVFLVLYLGCGILFEYILKIPQGFYQTPAIVVFLIALFVACVQNKKLSFNGKLKVMAEGLADENILTMCLVFLAAGAFSGAISAAGGAESTVYLFLTFLPPPGGRGRSVPDRLLRLHLHGHLRWYHLRSGSPLPSP